MVITVIRQLTGVTVVGCTSISIVNCQSATGMIFVLLMYGTFQKKKQQLPEFLSQFVECILEAKLCLVKALNVFPDDESFIKSVWNMCCVTLLNYQICGVNRFDVEIDSKRNRVNLELLEY